MSANACAQQTYKTELKKNRNEILIRLGIKARKLGSSNAWRVAVVAGQGGSRTVMILSGRKLRNRGQIFGLFSPLFSIVQLPFSLPSASDRRAGAGGVVVPGDLAGLLLTPTGYGVTKVYTPAGVHAAL